MGIPGITIHTTVLTALIRIQGPAHTDIRTVHLIEDGFRMDDNVLRLLVFFPCGLIMVLMKAIGGIDLGSPTLQDV
jgi:hypothetical protein